MAYESPTATASAAGKASSGELELGVCTDMTWDIPAKDQRRVAHYIGESNAKWARLSISWWMMEQDQGHYDRTYMRYISRAIDLTRAAGARVLMVLNQSPPWASGAGDDKNAPPMRRHLKEWRKFCQAMAKAFGSRVSAWEVWNEQNTVRFWPGGVDAGEYAMLLKSAYRGLKSGDPKSPVLYGGTSLNDYGFLQAVYDADDDIADFFDVVATHPYSQPLNSAPSAVLGLDQGLPNGNSFRGIESIRRVQDDNNDLKPIWATEIGWATYPGGVSAATQAAYMKEAVGILQGLDYVDTMFWYNLRNNWWSEDAMTWEDQLGLLNTDYSTKSAFKAFRRLAR